MKSLLKFSISAAVLVCLVVAAIAAGNVTGVWKGTIKLDTSKLPKPKNAQEQQMMQQGIDMVKKMKITLTLNANKTYSASFTGGPGGASKTSTGKWVQSGNTVTITPVKEDGKAVTGNQAKPQKLTVSSDGKTLTMTPPGQSGGPTATVIFVR